MSLVDQLAKCMLSWWCSSLLVVVCPKYRLLWHGHQVMYNQLASWMVYGILQDQHGEFFIRR